MTRSFETRPPTLKDRHWPLGRALAWIVTRDIERVGELKPTAELMELLVSAAFWKGDGISLFAEPNDAWRQMSARIIEGDVEATGRVFVTNFEVSKRQPLEVIADDYALGSLYSQILEFPGVHLEAIRSTERIVDVRVRVSSLLTAFPADADAMVATKPKGGRPPEYPWTDAETFAMGLLEHNGLPDAMDPEFNSQAKLESLISDFMSERHPDGKTPAESSIRKLAARCIGKFKAEKTLGAARPKTSVE